MLLLAVKWKDGMETIPLTDALGARKEELVRAILVGKILIYPTDTIYGIGCDARNRASVRLIKRLKRRDAKKPVSIIAPSKQWIRSHLRVRHAYFLSKLPGPYTFVWEKKTNAFLSEVSKSTTLGVRIPDHPFVSLIRKAGVPFVTTSVNLSGDSPVRRVGEIPPSFARRVAYAIDAGKLGGRPSSLYDLKGPTPLRLR